MSEAGNRKWAALPVFVDQRRGVRPVLQQQQHALGYAVNADIQQTEAYVDRLSGVPAVSKRVAMLGDVEADRLSVLPQSSSIDLVRSWVAVRLFGLESGRRR